MQSKHDPRHARSRTTGLIASILAALLFGVLWPAVAHAVPRDATLARGMAWINVEVPYSQARYYGGYRTDCSGFVSMCWATRGSYNTKTLHDVAHPISVNDLRPGDALLRAGYHVRLFAGWIDDAHTRYVAYEQTSPGAVQTTKYIASDLASGYIPYRYNGIEESPASWNLLANPTFDVWSGDSAIWWTASTDASGTVSRRSLIGARSPRFSLGVMNRSTNPSVTAKVDQTTAVEASRTYTLLAYAWTDREPRSVQMRLQFLDARGGTLLDTSITGDVAGIARSGFTPMTITRAAPSGATAATVSFRLAGGAYVATDTAGTALFDDVALYMSSPMPVYRFFNVRTGTHFYTASGTERDTVMRTLWTAYKYEGIAYSVGSTPANNQNLYRFFDLKRGVHFYTASEAEKDNVVRTLSSIYRLEGVAYKVSLSPAGGATPVYRFYNVRQGVHFYTASEAEKNRVVATLSSIYRLEGVGYYLAP
jgi:hypothetical protein